MSENEYTSDDEATTDDDNKDHDSSSDIERIAHIISDAEDDHKDKTELKEEMEGLTELEMRQRTVQITNEIKGCRKKIRMRLERKVNDVKSSDTSARAPSASTVTNEVSPRKPRR